MTIHIASDHAGFAYKQQLVSYLQSIGHSVIDHGAHELHEDDDYPDYILPCAQAVVGEEGSFGIIFGGSGQGEGMAANKVPGVRCAVYYGNNKDIITLSREHNNANMLSLGARFISEEEMIQVVTQWLQTPFSHDVRHVRRIAKY